MLPCPHAGRAPPFPVDEKEEKILKIPSFRPHAHAGPGLPSARDRPSLLSPPGEVGDLAERLRAKRLPVRQLPDQDLPASSADSGGVVFNRAFFILC